MKTCFTAAAAFGGCTTLRWYLDRSSRRNVSLCGDRIRLTDVRNSGAAFGLPIPRELAEPLSAAALGAVWALRRRSPLGAGLALGGGYSNLWERIRCGEVCDYLQVPKAPEPWNRYVFNLADIAILAGGLCLAAGGLQKERADHGKTHVRHHSHCKKLL